MPNFNEIASKPVGEIERPPLPPVGTYRWKVIKLPEQSKVGKDDMYDVVTFNVQAQEALDNVDFADYKGDVAGIFNRVVFLFDTTDEAKFDQTLFRLKNFFEKHLLIDGADSLAITEALNASPGCEFLGDIKWRQDKNDDELFHAEISKTAPVE